MLCAFLGLVYFVSSERTRRILFEQTHCTEQRVLMKGAQDDEISAPSGITEYPCIEDLVFEKMGTDVESSSG